MRTALAVLMVLTAMTTLSSCARPRSEPRNCLVTGRGSSADFLIARRVCAMAEYRFAQLTGVTAPAGGIVLSREGGMVAEAGRSEWRLQWPTSARMRETARELQLDEADVSREWETTLPHELGHLMLAANLFRDGLPHASDEYGTPLPDWIDEGAGIWMEPEPSRAERLRQAVTLANAATVSLDELLRTKHPLASRPDGPYATRIVINPPCVRCARVNPDQTQRVAYRYFRDGRTAVDTTYLSATAAVNEPEARFYALSYALLAYLRDRGGKSAIQELLARGRRDPSGELLAGLPGIPADAATIEHEWRRWMIARAAPPPAPRRKN